MKAGKQQQAQRGITSLEALMVLGITAVMLGTAVPGLGEMQDRRRLEGAAAQLETELQFTRSLAVADPRQVRVSFQSSAAQSCYVIHTGSANACRCEGPQTTCNAGAAEVRTVRFDADSRLRLNVNSASILFDPIKGTVTPTATLRLANTRGDGINLVVNIMGRIRSCSPTGLVGHKPC